MESVTQQLAKFAADLRYEDLPQEVVHQAERLILDTVCCTIAGYAHDAGKIFNQFADTLGGEPEATILPSGKRRSVASAAFVNGALAHLLDLDDCLLTFSHIAIGSVMTPLAMAEKQRSSGKDLVCAVVAAYEVSARVGLSVPALFKVKSPPPDLKLEFMDPFGMSHNVFGNAVGCAKLLGLDADAMAHAMGIAGYTTPVHAHNKATSLPRNHMMKHIPFGWINWAGAIAASLASEGLEADTTVLDGEHGYWKMSGSESVDFDIMTRDIGSKWWLMDTSIKPYPAATYMRSSLWAMDKIINEHGIQPSEISKIIVKTWPLRENSPFTQAKAKGALDAQVSYPYLLAMRAHRVPPNKWQTKEVISDPAIIDTIGKVEIERADAAAMVLYEQLTDSLRRVRRVPSTVVVHARGQVFSEYAEFGKGDPYSDETRLSDEELMTKFRAHTERLIRSSHVEPAIDALLHMSKVKDVTTVVPLFAA